MTSPYFCNESSVWIPSASEGAIAHEGVYGYQQWSRLFIKKRKKKFFDFVVWTFPFLSLVLLLVQLASAVNDPLLEIMWVGISVATLCITIGIHFRYGFLARSHFFKKFFQLDLWIGLFFLASTIEYFIQHPWNHSPAYLSIFALGSFAWLQIRSVEVYFWKRRLKNHFKDSNYSWAKTGVPEKEISKWEYLLALVGCVSLVTFALGSGFLELPSFYIAAFLPTLVPQFQWLITRLFSRAEDKQFICQNFSHFRNLKTTELFMIDQCGVLTTDALKVKEVWIDHNEDYTDAEVKDVLRQLSALSEHPISAIIAAEFTSGRELMKIEKSEVVPHLGVIAEFEDLKRQKTAARLAGLTWQKLLQNEISEQGMEKIREWKSKKWWTIFLSLNRQVVSAIAWTAPTRSAPKKGFSPKVPAVLISSQTHLAEGVSEDAFDQSATGLLPLERDLQQKYWRERVKNILEVKASWDLASPNDFVFVSKRKDLKDGALGILGGNLESLVWSVETSKTFKRELATATLVSILGVGASFLIPFGGIAATCVIYTLGLAYSLKHN